MCTYLNKTGSKYYFRRPVPKDLLGRFTTSSGKPRTEWKYSLDAKDREAAKRLLRPHVIETDKMIDSARLALAAAAPSSPQHRSRIDHEAEERQAQAELAEEQVQRQDARSGYRTVWRKRTYASTAEMDPVEAAAVDIFKEKDAEIARLQEALASLQASNERLGIKRLPLRGDPTAGKAKLSLAGLFERYAESGAANAKTVAKWRNRVGNLVEFLGHDDATRVERADLNAWTESLIKKGLAKKTVADGYIPAIRAAFSIAFEDGAISDNPATALKVRGPKRVKLRERDHTDDEAATILKAALGPQPEGLADDHARARRWVPWLCAYTGARVGEITQLRAMDIQQDEGIWFILISPEADGGVKTGEARKVPLHSHLVEQGFTAFAKPNDPTPLFFREGTGTELNPASKIRASNLASWIRSLGVETPQPNHGWRHRFKTMCRIVEITEEVMDKLQGHANPLQGRKYGQSPLKILHKAIEQLPRYEVL